MSDLLNQTINVENMCEQTMGKYTIWQIVPFKKVSDQTFATYIREFDTLIT